MSRLRSHNNRRRRALQGWHDPVKCPRHGLAYRGAGWAWAAGYRFAMFECPAPHCKNFKVIGDDATALTPAQREVF